MKRALGVITFAALNTGNVAFPESWKSIFVSVWLGKFFKLGKFVKAVVALFFRHIGCGGHALTLFVNKLKDRMGILPDFYLHAFYNRKNSAQLKHLGREGSYA